MTIDHETLEADRRLIKELGGPTKLAETLGYDKARGGPSLVGNWCRRGIPPAVKIKWPHLFLRDLTAQANQSDG